MSFAIRCLAFVVVFTVGFRAAHADRLLFESYVGGRPIEAARIAPLIRSVFERHGFIVDPQVLAMFFREHAYRPGLVAPGFADALKRAALRAEDDFSEEKYQKMIEDLGNLAVAMRQNAQIFTREPKYREFALSGLVFYALACGRQARVIAADKPDEAAKLERLRDDTMAEVIRSFPSKIITSKRYGDEGAKLFLRIRDQVNQAGRGRISIVSDPDAVIYINETAQGTGKVDVGDWVPGVYRVLIQMPTGESRQYEIEVVANQSARLVIDWSVDSLLVLLESWVGFKYPSEKEHAREATLAHLLAQTHTNASIVTTVTVTHAHGHLAVTGTSYETRSGQILQSGRVELTGSPSNDTMLNRLADCLVGVLCAEGVLPVSHPEYTPPPPEPKVEEPPPPIAPPPVEALTINRASTPGRSRRGWAKWGAAGGSAAMLALGGYLVNKSGTVCGFENPRCITRDYDLGGYAALDTGVALGALSLYWFFDLSPEELPERWLVGGGAAALAVGIGLYAIDQDPSGETPRYRDSAPPGIAVGVLGLASIGVGVWCWTRDTHASSMPTVSLSSSRATVGWQGEF